MKGLIALAVLIALVGCTPNHRLGDSKQGIISEAGQVRYVNLDTGFYGIIGEDGKKFEPVNLPANFQVNRTNVTFRAKPRPDVLSTHMWGTPVEILDIKADTK